MNQQPYPFMPFFPMNPLETGGNYNNYNTNNYNELTNKIERLEKNVKRLESRVYKLENKYNNNTEILKKEYILRSAYSVSFTIMFFTLSTIRLVFIFSFTSFFILL